MKKTTISLLVILIALIGVAVPSMPEVVDQYMDYIKSTDALVFKDSECMGLIIPIPEVFIDSGYFSGGIAIEGHKTDMFAGGNAGLMLMIANVSYEAMIVYPGHFEVDGVMCDSFFDIKDYGHKIAAIIDPGVVMWLIAVANYQDKYPVIKFRERSYKSISSNFYSIIMDYYLSYWK